MKFQVYALPIGNGFVLQIENQHGRKWQNKETVFDYGNAMEDVMVLSEWLNSGHKLENKDSWKEV